VLKAVSEQGVRLNIKKATLRHWRSQFASHLRALGVAANATERAVHGESRTPKKDGIYRSSLRGESTHMRSRVEEIASEVRNERERPDVAARELIETRTLVESGWRAAISILHRSGHHALAAKTDQFLRVLSPIQTDRDLLLSELRTVRIAERLHERSR
ncbi:MAG: hypothetical protein K1X67_09525, partial [Fimbriimonadaceae bacterium]|nr:hypothetical protein [Fimbriimonadaceae bacterium]